MLKSFRLNVSAHELFLLSMYKEMIVRAAEKEMASGHLFLVPRYRVQDHWPDKRKMMVKLDLVSYPI